MYTRPDAISLLVNGIKNYDYICADCYWLDCAVWSANIKSFTYMHPFLISTMLIKKQIFDHQNFLDPKYPMVGDYDLFYRICSDEKLTGTELNEVVTILRPGGYSQSSSIQHISETKSIYKKFFGKYFTKHELYKIHSNNATPITLLKVFLFIKNKKIRDSIFPDKNGTFLFYCSWFKSRNVKS